MGRLIDIDSLKGCAIIRPTSHETIEHIKQCWDDVLNHDNIPTAFDTEKVVEQLNNVLQDLNVIEVISHIDFDSTIQTSLENFLNAFKSEIMRIVKNNACIDELLKGEEG